MDIFDEYLMKNDTNKTKRISISVFNHNNNKK